jgi:hypothetical protein
VYLDATGLEIGDYMAELRISSNDPDNALVTVPMTMKVREVSVSVFSDQHSICQGDTVYLSSELIGGSASTTFEWSSDPDGFYSDTSHTYAMPDTTTTYTLVVTEGDVQVSDDVTVIVFPLPEVELGENIDMCAGDSTILDAGEGHHWYLWSTGDTVQSITVEDAGEYWVTVAGVHDCIRSDTLMVSINPLPAVNLGQDTILCYYHDIILDAGNPGASYLWSTGAESQTIIVDSTGMATGLKTISVEVTSADGCLSSDTINISFIECLGIDEIPVMENLQVYPNPGNGLFTIAAAKDKAVAGNMLITSAHGMVVFQQKDFLLEAGSNLEINLRTLPEGVYTMQVISDNTLFQARLIINH